MKLCIVGGGNIGTLLAAELAHDGNRVVLYTSKPARWSDSLEVFDADDNLLFKTGGVSVTDRWEEALEDAEQIWITQPSFLFPSLAEEMLPYTHRGQMILCIPGCGAEFSFAKHIEKGCVLCGLQRVHCIARLKQYGHAVYSLGRKPAIQLAAVPASRAAYYADSVSGLLHMPCETVSNYLAVTLTPSNPILHTTRIRSMFRDYRPGVFYDHNILFYEEWTDDASRLMLACDAELQQICAALPGLDLRAVRSLKLHYESDTPEKMTAKISGIRAFRGLTSPMKQVEGGWIPDFSSRYFTADFPFGLKILKDVGALTGVPTPNIDEVWGWYVKNCRGENDPYFTLTLKTPGELYDFYLSER